MFIKIELTEKQAEKIIESLTGDIEQHKNWIVSAVRSNNEKWGKETLRNLDVLTAIRTNINGSIRQQREEK